MKAARKYAEKLKSPNHIIDDPDESEGVSATKKRNKKA